MKTTMAMYFFYPCSLLLLSPECWKKPHGV